MMDDITLHYMIESEKAHFDAVEKRRQRAILHKESRDVLAHYDQMQNKSMKVMIKLKAMKYRRECEEM